MFEARADWHARLERYTGTRALVLGATGFIGRWVTGYLVDLGAKTFAGIRNQESASATLGAIAGQAEMIHIDLRDPHSVRHVVQRVRPAITFNLVAYGVDPAERDPEVARLINSDAVVSLCEATSRAKPPEWEGLAIVHAGSAAEYGTVRGPVAEDSLVQPTSVYGKTKLAGTRGLSDSAKHLGIRALTARLFMVYGPGEPAHRLLPALLAAARERRAIDLTQGVEARDFTYVEDVAEGLLRLGLTAARPGEVVNLATGRLTTIRQFAEKAADLAGMPRNDLRFGERESGSHEIFHGSVSIARLRELTGWSPFTTVEEGIWRTIRTPDGSSA